MSPKMEATNNYGIMSSGANAQNTINNYSQNIPVEINWEKLRNEIAQLETNSNTSIKKFAGEASEMIKEKSSDKLKAWLKKWIPYISGFIESSYYILEIAKNFNITG